MKVHLYRKDIDLSFIEVHPGEWVVLKPNLIKESKETDPDEWECVVTSPGIIELVCADVCRKLAGSGKVTICDAPQTDSSFAAIAERLDLHGIARRCSEEFGIEVEVLDLRNEEWVGEGGIIVERRKQAGDPNGTIAFDLGRDSLFHGHPGEGRYYGADYDAGVVNSHHRGDTQEYLICATPILADVFINLPKMKTHKKTGVTLNLKNLVGINADKNWLPHHSEGSPADGGDQFPAMERRARLEQRAVSFARRLALGLPWLGPRIAKLLRRAGTGVFGGTDEVVRSGNWYGNDTTWRMALDLNRCLLHGNPDGSLGRATPKRYYCLIDGLVGMEGSGPMQGDPIQSNVVVGGTDPAAVDAVASRVMGFDWRKLAIVREAFELEKLPVTTTRPEEIEVVSDVEEWNGPLSELESQDFLHFEPHFGWKGHVEYEG
ncbi:MAG: DUF362 domain-containing protein [Deltaproteobacteria bacterium]|nr:DUF362 domain-containing protein [Deltaproteobacteria bacterium]MBW2417896.1 DUF362 domain-containing protein [Deltaproteobacteria bacterium]